MAAVTFDACCAWLMHTRLCHQMKVQEGIFFSWEIKFIYFHAILFQIPSLKQPATLILHAGNTRRNRTSYKCRHCCIKWKLEWDLFNILYVCIRYSWLRIIITSHHSELILSQLSCGSCEWSSPEADTRSCNAI